jgi:hypothetical protein
MSSPIFIYLNSDTLVTLDVLTDPSDGDYDNSATITMSLYDSTNTLVTGANNIAFSYIASSDGQYQGTITSTIGALLTEGAKYYLKPSVVNGTVDVLGRHICIAVWYDGEG